MTSDPHSKEPDFSSGTVVFALLLNKSAIGIYTSYEKAQQAWAVFKQEEPSATWNHQIKPFRLDGPARIYSPY